MRKQREEPKGEHRPATLRSVAERSRESELREFPGKEVFITM
jgi:hypothetical protein